jgi:hypothetical protein
MYSELARHRCASAAMETPTWKRRQGQNANEVWRMCARFQNQSRSFRKGSSAHA